MPAPNPNKDLTAEQVVHLFVKNLPQLQTGLRADRDWLWWAGPKPAEAERKLLVELGFAFTGKPHALEGGETAHWYHACSHPVFRRHSKGGRVVSISSRSRSRAEPTDEPASEIARLAAFAA